MEPSKKPERRGSGGFLVGELGDVLGAGRPCPREGQHGWTSPVLLPGLRGTVPACSLEVAQPLSHHSLCCCCRDGSGRGEVEVYLLYRSEVGGPWVHSHGPTSSPVSVLLSFRVRLTPVLSNPWPSCKFTGSCGPGAGRQPGAQEEVGVATGSDQGDGTLFLHPYAHMYRHAYTQKGMCVHKHACAHTCTHNTHKNTHTQTRVYKCMCTYNTCTQICAHTNAQTHTQAWALACMHVHTH